MNGVITKISIKIEKEENRQKNKKKRIYFAKKFIKKILFIPENCG
jgi:hypothetical protein